MFSIYSYRKDFQTDYSRYLAEGDLIFSFDINEQYVKTYYYDESDGRNVITKHKYTDNQTTLQYKEFYSTSINYFEFTFNKRNKIEIRYNAEKNIIEFNGVLSDYSVPQKLLFDSEYVFFSHEKSVGLLDFVNHSCNEIIKYIK